MVSEIVYIFFEATCAFGKNVYDYEFWHAGNPLVVVSTVQSRQFYIGVNRKCPESFLPIFLPDAATQALTWGTVVIPYPRKRL